MSVVFAGKTLLVNSIGFILLTAWCVSILVYSFRYKKLMVLGLYFGSIPLLVSSMVEIVLISWLFGWWILVVSKTLPGRYGKTGAKLAFWSMFKTYLFSTTNLLIAFAVASAVPDVIKLFMYPNKSPSAVNLPIAVTYIVFILTFFIFAYCLGQRGRTFIEDMTQTVVIDRTGANLGFFRSSVRYFLMIITFPFAFGLVNFLFNEPLYNKLTGAVEFENQTPAIKNGWLLRTSFGSKNTANE